MPHAIRIVIGLLMPYATWCGFCLSAFVLLCAGTAMSLCLQCTSLERIREVKPIHSVLDVRVTESAYHVDTDAKK